jgi:hypothetical protein
LYGGEILASWEDFTRALFIRFSNREDMVEEFNKLVQDKKKGWICGRFEELKSLMNDLNPSLLESYYVSSFISILKDISPMLKILKPTILMQAFKQVKW